MKTWKIVDYTIIFKIECDISSRSVLNALVSLTLIDYEVVNLRLNMNHKNLDLELLSLFDGVFEANMIFVEMS